MLNIIAFILASLLGFSLFLAQRKPANKIIRKKYFIRSACALVGIEVMVLTILAIMQPEIFAVYPLHVALLGGLIAGLLMVNVVRTFFSVKKLVDLNKNK